MALNLSSTKDSAGGKATVLLYGDNGSGKTTFAATWPYPVFLVPEFAANEMKSLSEMDLPVILFENRKHLKAQVEELGDAVKKGNLRCDTLIVDNLTAMQLVVQEELKKEADVDKMKFDEWNKFTAVFKGLLTSLHKMPPHVIWITHQKITTADDKRIGELMLVADSRKLFPTYADLMLHAEVIDLRKAGVEYRLHLKPHDIWPCRMRVPRGQSTALPAYLVDPHYDQIAAFMSWPSCAEIEGRVEAVD